MKTRAVHGHIRTRRRSPKRQRMPATSGKANRTKTHTSANIGRNTRRPPFDRTIIGTTDCAMCAHLPMLSHQLNQSSALKRATQAIHARTPIRSVPMSRESSYVKTMTEGDSRNSAIVDYTPRPHQPHLPSCLAPVRGHVQELNRKSFGTETDEQVGINKKTRRATAPCKNASLYCKSPKPT